jgi:hypothetical protein
MSDLVRVLRGQRIDGRGADEIMRRAADEIELLRALLREAHRAVIYMCSDGAATWASLARRIDAALAAGGER